MKWPSLLKFKSLFKNETKIVTPQLLYVVVRISKDKKNRNHIKRKRIKMDSPILLTY